MVRIRKIELINLLQDFHDYISPQISLEQYSLDAISAADIIFIAGFEHDDIFGQNILDLGCGVGRLMGGALAFEAGHAVGIDVDLAALQIAEKNLVTHNLKKRGELFQADILQSHLHLKDPSSWTILANPPFGVHERGADTRFIKLALEIGDTIYSVHLAHPQNRQYLQKFYEKHGFKIDIIYELGVKLSHTYHFHQKKYKTIKTNLFRAVRTLVIN